MASTGSLIKLRGVALLICAVWTAWSAGEAVGQAPHEDWRTLTTEHFRVTFPAHLEALGRRAAGHAEAAYQALSSLLPEAGGSRIDVLVTDHSDLSNGFAQVRPSKRITVLAAPPTDGLQLGYYDDWMELVITHELAHVLHLDHTGTLAGELGRTVFGRAPTDWPLFPGMATPDWVIEGLATWFESRYTTAGRVNGTFHEMQLRTAVLEGRFEDIDAASGRSPLWPGGNRSYLYGSLFFDHLLERYGEDSMTAFVDAVAGQWIPYRIDAAARSSFGVSFSDAWVDWGSALADRYASLDRELAATAPVTEPERLTHGVRWGLHPQVSPDGRVLVYTTSDGRSDTQLRRSEPDGSEARQLVRTNSLATFDWTPDGNLLVSQFENQDPYTTYGDLYLVDEEGGTRRLTRGARLMHPSVSPDGSWAVAVEQGAGTNALVRVDLATGSVTSLGGPVDDVHWAFPSISPDGRRIAASRWDAGAYLDVVLLDSDGEEIGRLTSDRAMDVAPDWSPDGRWIVWSSDRTGIPNVLAAQVDATSGRVSEPRLLTNVRTGATYPSVDPTGRWLYFSGHHVDGWEVERVRFQPGAAPAAPPPVSRFDDPTNPRDDPGEAPGEVAGFSSLPTLWPRYWEPLYREPVVTPAFAGGGLDLRRREILGFGLGAETGSIDLVGRHEYSAFVHVFTSGGKAEGGLTYTFRGLGNPIFALAATQTYGSGGRVLSGPLPDTSFVLERRRGVGASATFLSTRWRRDLALTLGGALAWTHRAQLDNQLRAEPLDPGVSPSLRFADLSVTLRYSTARAHSFQLGGTRGFDVSVTGRRRLHFGVDPADRDVSGVDFSFDELFGRGRAYVPLWRVGHAAHVLALQASGGEAFGPQSSFGRFGVGGASGSSEQVTGFTLFGGNPVPLPVRGYEIASRFGRKAWAATAEYRFPLLLVNRGLGAWPLHLDRVVGALFADVGNAWDPSPLGDPLASVGAELSTQFLATFEAPLLVRAGLAFPLVESSGASVYVRVGLSF